jgi:D-alanyl-D-alanine carboxypeptidase/D-alanyl-D-alanine-endopeptidase (penicillin-binding protein 4)
LSLRPKILDCPGLKWLARLLLLLTLLAQPQLPALARRPSNQLQAGLAGEKSPPQPIEHGHEHRNLDLDRRIEKILDRSDAQRGSLGIQVVEVGTGEVLHEREADHLFIPASNVKMFTTAAALEKLGPGYVFHTTLEIDAAPDVEGRVGDLYLVGRGDPNLGARIFPYVYHGPQQPADTFVQEMADQVQAHGVREVTGRLVADDTYFVWEPFAPNWNADDLEFGYGAPVTALAFNDNSLTLAVKPAGKVGDPASVSLSPVPDYYLLKNHILTSARGSEKNHHLERQPGSMELDLWGQLPIDGGDDTDTLAISNPPQLLAEQLAAALRARGIVVDGAVEVRHITRLEASSPASASPVPPRIILADHTSPPLAEAIKVVNKESENLHAEMLLRTLGRVLNNQGSLEAGLAALNSFATQQVGILPGETYFSDGSGLSREDLVAPQAAVKLLLYMTSSPNYQAFFKSLPVSGIDGTLIHRLLSDEVKGRIHAKTGSVEHVNTLSGYMDLPSGKRLAFSIMLNNHPLSTEDGQETLDAIAVAIFKHYAKHPG